MKVIFAYLVLSICLALFSLAGSTNTICHFTHSQTYMTHNPEQIILMCFSLFNLLIVLFKLFKQLPPVEQEFQQDSIFIDNHSMIKDAGFG